MKYKKENIYLNILIHSFSNTTKKTRDIFMKLKKYSSENPMHGKRKSRMLAYFIMASIRENCIFYIVGKSSSITWDMDHSCRDIFRFSPGIYNLASIYTVWASREKKTISQMDLFLSEGSSDGIIVTGNSSHLAKICENMKAHIEQNHRLLLEDFNFF